MQIYTDAAQAALRQAKRISGQMKHPYTGTEHILLGLLREQESTAGQVLINAGVTEAGLTDMISQLIAPEGGMLPEEGRSFTPRARKILDDAQMEAHRFHERLVGTEHILIAIFKDGECVGSRLLTTMGVRVRDIYVGEEPLDVNRTYTLASHNYMLKSAGDGMTMFKDAKILKDEVMTDVDVLSDYINTHLGGNVGAEYANPAGQGRIVIK